ncbi:MAG: SGNH/GDSL hydrolase family protein [Bdellovibrionaceae bacterium]|nr:SGNH/GDSL hydrolase family protein [Pseudobdellovibrionaceae bacterium]
MKKLRNLLLLLTLVVPIFGSARQISEIGIVGDSGITGAAAEPHLALELISLGSRIGGFLMGPIVKDSLIAQILNISDPSVPHPEISAYGPAFQEFHLLEDLPSPIRVYFSDAEVDFDKKNIVDLNLSALGSKKIDLLQYSSPYLLGNALGLSPEKIIYVAQDGQRTSSISKQFRRFFVVPRIAKRNYLPELIFISYTANDFCSEDVLNQSSKQVVANYKKILRDQLVDVRKTYRANPKGTHVVYMAPLNVTQIFDNDALLNSRVPFLDGEVICLDLRSHSPVLTQTSLRTKAFNALLGMCPSILKTKITDTNRIQHFKNIFNGVVQAQAQVVAELDSAQPDGWSFSHFKDSNDLNFDTDDTANDCFHPGLGAHIKLARRLLLHLKTILH